MDELMNHRSKVRQVARVSFSDGWSPHGVSEVVAHTDGRFLTVTITKSTDGRGAVYMEEFDCASHEACRRDIRGWLYGIAQLVPSESKLVAEWADLVTDRIMKGLAGRAERGTR